MKKISLLIAVGFISLVSLLNSCKKDDDTKPEESTITNDQVANIQDMSIATSSYDDVDIEVDEASTSTLKSMVEDSTSMPVVKIVSWERGKLVKELTFNGSTRYGKVKTGKIIITLTYPVAGDTTDEQKWVRTITFDNYIVNGRKLEGIKTITYLGKVDGTHPEWKVVLTGGKITFKSGKTLTCDYTRSRKMIKGYDTIIRSDNAFEINGSSSGINKKGLQYKTTSTSLVLEKGCPHFKSGSILYECDNKTLKVIFAAGDTCSSSATIEYNGKTKVIDAETESN